jgi:hypothetical protein
MGRKLHLEDVGLSWEELLVIAYDYTQILYSKQPAFAAARASIQSTGDNKQIRHKSLDGQVDL